MRKLATVEVIREINVHTNADSLELAVVRDWQVVVRKGEFKVGNKVVYFEIDSWIPNEIAPFLTKKDRYPHEFEGIKGERLRTVKLRNEISQGLIIPLLDSVKDFSVGEDVTEILGIKKWEKPLPTCLQGSVKGNFPFFIKRTDVERIQNCWNDIINLDSQLHWEVSEKLNGSSVTIYYHPEKGVGVCSRNLELKIEENGNNTYVSTVKNIGYLDVLEKLKLPIALQGELIGMKIQGNMYELKEFKIYIFDIWFIDKQRYASPKERYEIINIFKENGLNIDHVPLIGELPILPNINSCLKLADGKSLLNDKVNREGLVFKNTQINNTKIYNFKVISNNFLLNEK